MSRDAALPDTICTPQDLTGLIMELREYSKWYEHESIKRKVAVGDLSDAPSLSATTVKILTDLKAAVPLDRKSLTELISLYEDYAQTAPSISITLSGPPTLNVKKKIVAWCRENIAPNALVSFNFNGTLLGGMVVRSGSHVFDWSFRRQILAQRDKFPEVLRRVG